METSRRAERRPNHQTESVMNLAHAHPLATSGIPGWQLILMGVTVVLLAAVLVTIAYPGPGRSTAAERTHRPSDDHADPQDQPAALATPTLARQNHRAGP
jgi:hypothetical protein